jgi:hypothetical protein
MDEPRTRASRGAARLEPDRGGPRVRSWMNQCQEQMSELMNQGSPGSNAWDLEARKGRQDPCCSSPTQTHTEKPNPQT